MSLLLSGSFTSMALPLGFSVGERETTLWA